MRNRCSIQVGVGEPLQPGQRRRFDDGRYRWTLAITP
jgi:hypothetical protein